MENRAKELLRLGYAFPCAFCERLHVFRGKKAPSCEMESCGGPFSGRSFPDYKGPLTRSTLATHCFMCGDDVKEAIVAKDGGYIGVCDKHLNSTLPNNADTIIPSIEEPSKETL